ncbi:MAG: helix-turn-helix domain-containing protein [Nitrospirae bacterium]|jgi:excisionase family DNA binding protein|nr:helix-turn-helix domain-containing protein [Nitrospirota bacterium]
MSKSEYISLSEFAKILGISRIAVYKKIKKGQIKSVRIGRSFAIPRKYLNDIMGRTLSEKDKKIIDEAVKKTFKEYGELLKLLGRE